MPSICGSLTALGFLGVAAAGCTSPVASAAEAKLEPAPKKMVLVTGSRIRRPVRPDGSLPLTASSVRVLSRRQIDSTGEVRLDRILDKSLPSVGRE